ncbi:glycosyltransferase family 4 protein [Microbacterium sp. BWT-B31]|uniref:glycosyltransferase family 4 protein n=1 Tax=Microbacterium sp. BWT-B31 TaxID=3232072 RepID=UPI0035271681
MTELSTGGGGRELSVLYSFPHALGAPGIGWTAWNQANELVRAGHDVHLVVASLARAVEGAASVHTTLTVAGRRIPHRAVGRDRALRHHDRVAARIVARAARGGDRHGIDVVHAWPLAAERTFEAARRAGIASVREVPNTHTEHAYAVVEREIARLGLVPRKGASHTRSARHLRSEQREWAAATALLVPSDSVAQTFRDRGFDSRRLLRHRYGSNAAPYPRDASARPFTAVFLGRVEPRKGLHFALQAWAGSLAAQGGRLLVCGHVDAEYLRHLEPLLSAPGVRLCGVTDDPMRVLSEADVLLLPSVEEGSALVTYEAQVAGCVPMVSDAAGAVIDEGVTGLTHRVGDVTTLTRQLDALVTQPEVLRTMQEAAMRRAGELSWTAAAQLQVEAYLAAEHLKVELEDAPGR